MKIATVVLALALASCAPVQAVDGVRLTAERVSSEVIRLTLDNGASHPIGYNLCVSSLQQRSGTTWAPVGTDEICTMQLNTLNPGRDATFEKRLPAGLPSGEYRYVTSIENPLGSAQTPIATNAFSIRP